ncbi:MAG: hypothetical protein P8N14_02820 [Sulfitobacter sp.]|nr:hypothetical protein [Sulfitobacter sp.]
MTHLQHLRHLLLRGLFAVMLSTFMLGQSANAQTDPFERGWTLQPEMSSLNFQSVKKQTVVESSGFATMEGTIGPDGQTEVVVLLDSVDTKIDLRNVRMRFFCSLRHSTFQRLPSQPNWMPPCWTILPRCAVRRSQSLIP